MSYHKISIEKRKCIINMWQSGFSIKYISNAFDLHPVTTSYHINKGLESVNYEYNEKRNGVFNRFKRFDKYYHIRKEFSKSEIKEAIIQIDYNDFSGFKVYYDESYTKFKLIKDEKVKPNN